MAGTFIFLAQVHLLAIALMQLQKAFMFKCDTTADGKNAATR